MTDNYRESLGAVIRSARENSKASLRMVAKDLRVTPPYLSDIERNRRIPSEVIIARLSVYLGLDFDMLMQLAGRVGETAEKYVKADRLAGLLFRKIAEYEIDHAGLVKLLDIVEDMHIERQEEGTKSD